MMKVNNLDAEHERFVVARLVDGELWYWGSWNTDEAAIRVAQQFDNGVVVDMEENLMTEKLKPCPFCGGKAEFIIYWNLIAKRFTSVVRCTKCRANSGEWKQKPKAIEAWNRRATDADNN